MRQAAENYRATPEDCLCNGAAGPRYHKQNLTDRRRWLLNQASQRGRMPGRAPACGAEQTATPKRSEHAAVPRSSPPWQSASKQLTADRPRERNPGLAGGRLARQGNCGQAWDKLLDGPLPFAQHLSEIWRRQSHGGSQAMARCEPELTFPLRFLRRSIRCPEHWPCQGGQFF